MRLAARPRSFPPSPAVPMAAGVVVVLLIVALTTGGCSAAAAETKRETPAKSASTATAPTSGAGSSSDASATSASAAPAAAAGAKLFDDSVVHEIDITFDQADYEAMLETFSSTQEKDWIEATVTIDGHVYDNVGIRLKGNSSLGGLRDGGPKGGAGGKGPGAAASADKPEGLPWLIRLDKNVDGLNYDGIVNLVVRSNVTRTSLNEAVALELLQSAGLASQDAIAVRFSVNGETPVLRLVTELPDELWMDQNLDSAGALYKAESTGNYGYRGTDPDAYDEVFDQEAGEANADLTPLIEFLDFINKSDGATFAAELPLRLDVDSFATYLAMQDLVGNFDDIDGPGNNSYLFYDPRSGMFTVVPWDHNLAFNAMGANGGPRIGGGANGAQAPEGAVQAPNRVWPAPPDGATQGGVIQGYAGAAGGGQTRPGGAPGDDRKVGVRGANILSQRFLANADFKALYQKRLTELADTLYRSGAASDILATWVALLESQAADLVDKSTVESDAAKIAAFFDKTY